MKCIRTFSFVLLLAQVSSIHGATYHVATNSPSNGPGTTWSNAFHTIHGGVDATAQGDTVLVTNGTYNLSTGIGVGEAVTVKSLNGAGVTIVDGQDAHGGFQIGGAAVIDGFTIRNCRTGTSGAAVYCYKTGTIQNCTITGNSANTGGGVAFFLGGGTVQNCTITGNSALFSGGGVSCSYGGTVRNCTITGNSANDGGGVRCSEGGTVQNCSVSSNSVTTSGGGVGCSYGGTVRNCTITGNSADEGGGVSCYGGGEQCGTRSSATMRPGHQPRTGTTAQATPTTTIAARRRPTACRAAKAASQMVRDSLRLQISGFELTHRVSTLESMLRGWPGLWM